jgi:hypothetical protein
MPGIGELIDGAMQQAAQRSRHGLPSPLCAGSNIAAPSCAFHPMMAAASRCRAV